MLKLVFRAALSAYYATRATVPRAGVSLTVPVFFKEGANAILRKRSSLQKKCTHGRCQTCGHPTPQQRKHRRRRPLWRVRYRRNKPRGKSTEEGPQTPQLSATTGTKRTPARAHSSEEWATFWASRRAATDFLRGLCLEALFESLKHASGAQKLPAAVRHAWCSGALPFAEGKVYI